MERAYSTVTITKAVASERTVEGIASVPSVDRQGDIVESKGVRWRKDAAGKPDVPWLMQHRHHEPIGRIEWLQAKPDGLRFRARMPTVDGPPALKERLDTAFGEIAAGLVRGISIGFMPLKAEPIETGWRFKEISLYEISSVTIPACEEACVEVVKRYDEAARRGEPNDAAIRRGEVPALARANPLWRRVADAGSAAIDRTEASEEFRKVGPTLGTAMITGNCSTAMIKALVDHVASLEERLDERGPQYRGIWKADKLYPANCFVTHSGSMWHSATATERKPGEGDWVLAVKRGADAR